MLRNPGFFSSVLPACGSCQIVEESRSRGVRRHGQVSRWTDGQIATEEPGIRRAQRVELTTALEPQAGSWRRDPPAPRLLHLSTAKWGEQSQNVYENKRQGQNVEENCGGDPCGRSRGTTRVALQNLGNKARMFMKTKDEDKKLRSQRVEELRGARTKSRLRRSPSGRRPEDSGRLLDFSTAQLLNSVFHRNKPRMSMKTKHKYKKSLRRSVSLSLPTHIATWSGLQ